MRARRSFDDSSYAADLKRRRRQLLDLFSMLHVAAEPFTRPRPRFVIGPERFSLARIEREWGESSGNCKATFRFTLLELRRLLVGLRLPDVVHVGPPGHVSKFAGDEVLLIVLRRLAYPITWDKLVWEAGRSMSQLSRAFKWGTRYLMSAHPHLYDHRSLECWAPSFARFASAVHQKGGAKSLSNCAMFVDGSLQRLDRPGVYQHILYNGHKRCHCVKWQGIMLPNGIMPFPYGPVNGRHNDSYMMDKSELERILRRCSNGLGRIFCAYGDAAYPASHYIRCPFKHLLLTIQEATFNKCMSKARIPNEWGFGKLKLNFAFLDYKNGLKPFKNDVSVYWPVANMLNNCHTCLNGSQTNLYFGIPAPELEEYLRMGADFPVFQ